MSLNKVLLIGNVGQDPEVRYLDQNANGSGAKVATLRLATSERFKDRSGNLTERTEWHTVVFWRNQAEIVEKYVRKGSQIFVEGRLRTREWTDKDGNTRRTTEINADNMQLLDRRNAGEGAPAPAPVHSAPAPAPAANPATDLPAGFGAAAPIAPATPLSPEEAGDDLPF